MDVINFIKDKLFKTGGAEIPAEGVPSLNATRDKEHLQKYGVLSSDLSTMISSMLLIGTDRRNIYTEIEKSLAHPLMASAAEVYADKSCTRSPINNATIWAEAKNKDYQYELDKLFDIMNLEEVIYDWVWTVVTYGDLFVEMNSTPGVGVVSVNDNDHPLDVSRLDHNGRLIGFAKTPQGLSVGDKSQLLPPWQYAHFRLLGAKKRRSLGIQDPTFTEYRTMSMMVPDYRRLSSKYGTSIFNNSLTVYKRLKMSEDSLLMARISRSIIRYVYKVVVDPNTAPDAAAQIINEYIGTLKRGRTLDIDGSGAFGDRTDFLTNMEDIILPVWGNKDGLSVDKLGGEVDIKWIADVDELRNQLASALRVPLSMLGGYSKEAPPALGDGAGTELDIRFSRQCHRIQRAIISGVTRMVQIHLSMQGKDPDLDLFEVKMAETSTAAEEQLRDSLDKGVDVVDKIMLMLDGALGDYDKIEALDFLNKKILKLNDFDFEKLMSKTTGLGTGPIGTPEIPAGEKADNIANNAFADQLNASKEEDKDKKYVTKKLADSRRNENADLKALVPKLREVNATDADGKPIMETIKVTNDLNETVDKEVPVKVFEVYNPVWDKYKNVPITVKTQKVGKKK